MATTTATITLSSGDIADNSFSVSNTSTLTNVGTDTGMTKTTGLSRLELSAVTKIVLFGAGGSTDSTPGTGAELSQTVDLGPIDNEDGIEGNLEQLFFRIEASVTE